MHLPLCAPAPARLSQSAGAVLFCILAAAACDRPEQRATEDERGPRVLELDSSRIELPDSIHQLVIRLDRSNPADLDRPHAELRVGDIVRFEAADAGGHALFFDAAALDPEARAWLESTGQLRSPPLIDAGNAWVVTFAGAPPGEYPFGCATHGAQGMLLVRARAP